MDGISKNSFPAVELKGLIASVEYSRYKYENITLTANTSKADLTER